MFNYKNCLVCGKKHIEQTYTCMPCWDKLNYKEKTYIWKIHETIPSYIPKEQFPKYLKTIYENHK